MQSSRRWLWTIYRSCNQLHALMPNRVQWTLFQVLIILTFWLHNFAHYQVQDLGNLYASWWRQETTCDVFMATGNDKQTSYTSSSTHYKVFWVTSYWGGTMLGWWTCFTKAKWTNNLFLLIGLQELPKPNVISLDWDFFSLIPISTVSLTISLAAMSITWWKKILWVISVTLLP